MTTPSRPDATPGDVFERAARAIFPGDDWQARLTQELGVGRNTVRQWVAGRMRLRRDHFETLLALLVARQEEMRKAEAELRAWLAQQPKEDRSWRRRDATEGVVGC